MRHKTCSKQCASQFRRRAGAAQALAVHADVMPRRMALLAAIEGNPGAMARELPSDAGHKRRDRALANMRRAGLVAVEAVVGRKGPVVYRYSVTSGGFALLSAARQAHGLGSQP